MKIKNALSELTFILFVASIAIMLILLSLTGIVAYRRWKGSTDVIRCKAIWSPPGFQLFRRAQHPSSSSVLQLNTHSNSSLLRSGVLTASTTSTTSCNSQNHNNNTTLCSEQSQSCTSIAIAEDGLAGQDVVESTRLFSEAGSNRNGFVDPNTESDKRQTRESHTNHAYKYARCRRCSNGPGEREESISAQCPTRAPPVPPTRGTSSLHSQVFFLSM